MNNVVPHPDVVTIILEIERLSKGGQPHVPGSAAAMAIDNAIHRCAQEAELAGIAALGRKAFAAAVAELSTQPLHAEFAKKPDAWPARPGKTRRGEPEAG